MIRSTLEKKEFIRVRDEGLAKSLNRFRNRHYPIWRDTDPGLPEVEVARKKLKGLKASNIRVN
jgi:hypothetical protein